jgi:hypothetical protein
MLIDRPDKKVCLVFVDHLSFKPLAELILALVAIFGAGRV